MERAIHDCWDVKAHQESKPVEVYRCQIKVYTEYSATEKLADAKERLAKIEQELAERAKDKAEKAERELTEKRAREASDRLMVYKYIERCAGLAPIRIGMTADQVLASKWGKPSDRHSTTTADHHREQWIYTVGPECGATGKQSYLYFEDGVLAAIQD
jgi:hypothetical protein